MALDFCVGVAAEPAEVVCEIVVPEVAVSWPFMADWAVVEVPTLPMVADAVADPPAVAEPKVDPVGFPLDDPMEVLDPETRRVSELDRAMEEESERGISPPVTDEVDAVVVEEVTAAAIFCANPIACQLRHFRAGVESAYQLCSCRHQKRCTHSSKTCLPTTKHL